jgi:hypothetical protein
MNIVTGDQTWQTKYIVTLNLFLEEFLYSDTNQFKACLLVRVT